MYPPCQPFHLLLQSWCAGRTGVSHYVSDMYHILAPAYMTLNLCSSSRRKKYFVWKVLTASVRRQDLGKIQLPTLYISYNCFFHNNILFLFGYFPLLEGEYKYMCDRVSEQSRSQYSFYGCRYITVVKSLHCLNMYKVQLHTSLNFRNLTSNTSWIAFHAEIRVKICIQRVHQVFRTDVPLIIFFNTHFIKKKNRVIAKSCPHLKKVPIYIYAWRDDFFVPGYFTNVNHLKYLLG